KLVGRFWFRRVVLFARIDKGPRLPGVRTINEELGALATRSRVDKIGIGRASPWRFDQRRGLCEERRSRLCRPRAREWTAKLETRRPRADAHGHSSKVGHRGGSRCTIHLDHPSIAITRAYRRARNNWNFDPQGIERSTNAGGMDSLDTCN